MVTILVIIELTKFPDPVRLCCGSGQLIFVIILSCFAILKNVVHSFKPVETKHFKRFVAVAVRLRLFFNLLKFRCTSKLQSLCSIAEYFCKICRSVRKGASAHSYMLKSNLLS